MMAVAVGVAVVALGAGVVGSLLQPHQHVHLKRAESMSSLPASPPPTPGLSQAHASSSRLTLGLRPTVEAVGKRMGSGPCFQGSNPGSTTY